MLSKHLILCCPLSFCLQSVHPTRSILPWAPVGSTVSPREPLGLFIQCSSLSTIGAPLFFFFCFSRGQSIFQCSSSLYSKCIVSSSIVAYFSELPSRNPTPKKKKGNFDLHLLFLLPEHFVFKHFLMYLFLNWSIVALQCCVSLYSTTMWISFIVYIYHLSSEPPSHSTTPN